MASSTKILPFQPHLFLFTVILRNLGTSLIKGFVPLLLLVGCNASALAAEAPPMEPRVQVSQASRQSVSEWDDYTGRLEAVSAVDIRARVGGYLQKVNFTAGAKVKQGDLLFVIDPKPYQAQLAFAKAELERAKTRHELAKNDLARAENLLQAKAISTEEYDARHKGLRESAAAVTSAEANVASAQLNLDYTEIRAPISGRIAREMVTAGNLINSGADAPALTRIVSIDPIYVYFDVDERALLKYRRQAQQHGHRPNDLKNTPLQLALADESGFLHQGKVDYVAPQENSGTGTVTVRGVFANDDELLSPGFFARLRVQNSAAHDALLLPERAIGSDLAQHYVWVVKEDSQLDYRAVTLGTQLGTLRVINSGLQSDDWVVIEGVQKLRAGMRVKTERVPLPGVEAR